MKNNKNLKPHEYDDSVIIAELWDVFGSTVFRLIIKGYESTRTEDEWDDWLDVDIEYASRSFYWQKEGWEINTLDLVRSLNSIKGFQGTNQNPQLLMEDYTGRDQLVMIYKKPYVRLKKWAQVFRKRSGHFLTGHFVADMVNTSFEFKVDRIQLLRFEKKLAEAIRKYPIRSKKFRAMLEGKPYWE
ncbi:MAG: WapI family immunity protein [Pseudobdellovibrionaceae bacterium]